MNLFTTAKISPQGKVNAEDLKRVANQALIFFAAPILIYFGQLSGTLAQHGVVLPKDFVPTLMTVGAIEGWFVGIVINFFLKLNNGKQ